MIKIVKKMVMFFICDRGHKHETLGTAQVCNSRKRSEAKKRYSFLEDGDILTIYRDGYTAKEMADARHIPTSKAYRLFDKAVKKYLALRAALLRDNCGDDEIAWRVAQICEGIKKERKVNKANRGSRNDH